MCPSVSSRSSTPTPAPQAGHASDCPRRQICRRLCSSNYSRLWKNSESSFVRYALGVAEARLYAHVGRSASGTSAAGLARRLRHIERCFRHVLEDLEASGVDSPRLRTATCSRSPPRWWMNWRRCMRLIRGTSCGGCARHRGCAASPKTPKQPRAGRFDHGPVCCGARQAVAVPEDGFVRPHPSVGRSRVAGIEVAVGQINVRPGLGWHVHYDSVTVLPQSVKVVFGRDLSSARTSSVCAPRPGATERAAHGVPWKSAGVATIGTLESSSGT